MMLGACDMKRHGIVVLLLLAACLSACADIPPEARSENDPWEPVNRTVYGFNQAVDAVTLKPLAKGYEKVLPQPVRRSITNFSRNLFTPSSALNNFLQGKPDGGFGELTRFVFNSTFGIGGLFDVAAAAGLEPRREDFGQTAAVWGVPAGPFVELPFLGPRTLRHAVLLPLEILVDPLHHYDETSVREKIWFLRLIELRARVLPAEKLLEDSKDRYITVRESFLQYREYEIYDGYPPEDDEFFDEFLDEE